MEQRTISQTTYNWIMIGLLAALEIINLLRVHTDWQWTVKRMAVSVGLIGLAACWCVIVIGNVSGRESGRVIRAISAMLLLWLVLRAVKYAVPGEKLENAIWYLYYLPQTLLPLLILQLTLYSESSRAARLCLFLYIPAALIIAGILTNDLHGLAFRFNGEHHSDSDFSYGPLYWISLTWLGILMLASVAHAVHASRLQHRYQTMWILIAWMLAALLYGLYYQTGPYFVRTYILNFPEAMCLIFTVFTEICLQSGLIASNRYHLEIFRASSVMAEITDRDGGVFRRTNSCPPLPRMDTNAAPVMLNNGCELHACEIPGGKVHWLNDVGRLLRVRDRLRDAAEELSEANDILGAEIAALEKKAALEEKNAILDSVSAALSEKGAEMIRLLEDPAQLKKALLMAAYLKRKGNLVILSRQEHASDIRELGFCIHESLSCAQLGGCVCSCIVSGSGCVPADDLLVFYDAFEKILEEIHDGLQALLCRIRLESGRLSLEMQADLDRACSKDAPEIADACRDFCISCSREIVDGTLYICLGKEVQDGTGQVGTGREARHG